MAEIYKFFRERECIVGNIKKRITKDSVIQDNIFINTQKSNYDILRDFIDNYETEISKSKLIDYGIKRIEAYAEINKGN
jgi:hypothetical protein